MLPPSGDYNLLFGILAVQMDFISRESLIAAMNAWVLEKKTPLGEILVRGNALSSETHGLLEAVVQQHIQIHGDAEKSLGSLSSIGSVAEDLGTLDDAEIQASLHHLSPGSASEGGTLNTEGVESSGPTGFRFRILRPHAKGGLGEVFVAQDTELHREVALKEIQGHSANNPIDRNRFHLEAEITGALEHPGVVPVYGLGHYPDGRPYYAMRFIRGDSLQKAIREFHQKSSGMNRGEHALALYQLLKRFVDVCNAIAYAHSRGVLHRDLKPGNVMLGPYGETLVVDWGLAKLLGETEESSTERPVQPKSSVSATPTVDGKVLGTPQYMAPEQAEGRLDLLGPPTDVYGLGATLYALLCGQPPVVETDPFTVLAKVKEGCFEPPTRINPRIPAPLEAVCLKAMAAAPRDRYPTAQQMAEDIEKWLADEPPEAYREPFLERAWRWARHHRGLVSAFATALLTLLLTGGGALFFITKAKNRADQLAVANANLAKQERLQKETIAQEQKKTAAALAIARKEAYSRAIALANRERLNNDVLRAEELLEKCPKDLRDWEWLALRQLCHIETLEVQQNRCAALGFINDTQHFVLTSPDGTVAIYDFITGKKIRAHQIPLTKSQTIYPPVLSPNGTQMIVPIRDTSAMLKPGEAQVWQLEPFQKLSMVKGHSMGILSARFSPSGKQIITGSMDGTAVLWDAQNQKELQTFKGPGGFVWEVAISPGEKWVAAYGDLENVHVWDAKTGKLQWVLGRIPQPGRGLAFSPDGRLIASGSNKGIIRLWDLSNGREVIRFAKHTGHIYDLEFSPNGHHLASGSTDSTLRVWDLIQQKELITFRGHIGSASEIAFSRNSQLLLSTDGSAAKVWSLTRPWAPLSLEGHTARIHGLSWSPNGERIATASADETVRVWNARTGERLRQFQGLLGGANSVDFSPNGKRLVTASTGNFFAGQPGKAQVWDLKTGNLVLTLQGHRSAVNFVRFSSSGAYIGTKSHWEPELILWDAQSGKLLRKIVAKARGSIKSSQFLSNDRLLLVERPDPGSKIAGDTIRILRIDDGREVASLHQPGHTVSSPLLSRNHRYLATRCSEIGKPESSVVWDLQGGSRIHLPDHLVLDIRQDGKQLITRSGGSLTLLSHPEGVEQARTSFPGYQARYSPMGNRALVTDGNGNIQILDTSNAESLLPLSSWGSPMNVLKQSPNGEAIAARVLGNTVKIWTFQEQSPGLREEQRKLAGQFHRQWHKTMARQSLGSGNWFGLRAHAQQLTEHLPKKPGPYAWRGHASAGLKSYDSALDDYAKAISLGESSPQVAYRYALLALTQQKQATYQKVCQQMLAKAVQTGKAVDVQWTLWTCSLASNSVEDYELLLAEARQRTEKNPKSPFWSRIYGALLLRAGQTKKALEALDQSLKMHRAMNLDRKSMATGALFRDFSGLFRDYDANFKRFLEAQVIPGEHSTLYLFLALAYHHSGQKELAKQSLQKAGAIIRQFSHGTGNQHALRWEADLELKILQEETERLIRAQR